MKNLKSICFVKKLILSIIVTVVYTLIITQLLFILTFKCQTIKAETRNGNRKEK